MKACRFESDHWYQFEMKCKYCNKEITNSKNKVYCNRKCKSQDESKVAIDKALVQMKENTIHHGCRIVMKKVLKKYFGFKDECCICGITEWQGKPLPFILDHIDGNPLNNYPYNLRIICSNCDSQLDTYKKKNKLGRGKRLKMLNA